MLTCHVKETDELGTPEFGRLTEIAEGLTQRPRGPRMESRFFQVRVETLPRPWTSLQARPKRTRGGANPAGARPQKTRDSPAVDETPWQRQKATWQRSTPLILKNVLRQHAMTNFFLCNYCPYFVSVPLSSELSFELQNFVRRLRTVKVSRLIYRQR